MIIYMRGVNYTKPIIRIVFTEIEDVLYASPSEDGYGEDIFNDEVTMV